MSKAYRFESKERIRAFLDVRIGTADRGRIVIELFNDIVPKTVENFRTFCTSAVHPMYRGCKFHRIIPGFIAQSGDWELNNGRGGHSIYPGGTFEDESFKGEASKHETFSVAMANAGPNCNGSQWFIELAPQPHLAGRHVVFGKVIQGFDIVRDIENQGTSRTGFPQADVTITNCGML